MPLPPGTRIGGYEIVALLGAGGMGEVYRARDSRLGRDIAIKILSPRIAADADAVARFGREARALASLNHPNIAAIYGVEDNGTQPALILELVTGTTLADRIARGPLAIGDAIAYATQIAEALDVAHESGIVHRDLKPGNIVITDDGRVKVLDFGLAKALAAAAGESPDVDPANSPTITVYGTQHGVILGTAAYMSPEQARGKRIDKRTDIWAFGCVLYEMLTGTRAFNGETASDVIAAIIERAPDLNRLPRSTPPHLRRVVERCLEKDPKRRARDIADVRSDLEGFEPAPPAARRSWALVGLSTLIAGVAIGVAGVSWSWRTVAVVPPAPIEFTLIPPSGYTLVAGAGIPSPDGSRIAYLASDDKNVPSLFVRALAAAASRRLEGTEGTTGVPVWSPDGRAIAFFVSGVWKRVSADGGPPVTIVADVVANLGASWGADDLFLVAPANRTSLARVQVTGGSLQPITILDTAKDNSHRWPTLLPDGRHYLFTVRSDSPERLGIKLGALDATEEVRSLVNVASQGVFAQPGWLLYVTPDEVLMAQRLDPSVWGVQGPPQPVVGPVRYNGPSFRGAFHASADGRVVTFIPSIRGASTLEWFDRTGKALGRVGPEREYRGLRLSRDGRQIAVELADPQVGTRDLWIIDTSTQALTRFTSHPATDWRPVFAPDGSAIAFASDRSGASTVFRGSTRSPGPEAALHRASEGGVFPTDWSRDGTSLLVTRDDKAGRPSGVVLVPVGGGAGSVVIDEGAASPRLSPDGTRIAFVGVGASDQEVYLMSIADQERIPISTDGGSHPTWGADGRELFFLNRGSEIMRAVIDGKTLVGRPEVLFRPCASLGRSFSGAAAEEAYDVTADGMRFLAVCDAPGTVPSAINVIVNWQSRLK